MTTLYMRLGGPAAIKKAVEIFYEKMLSDPRVAKFFETTDMPRQKAKQVAFLTMVTGGPVEYTGKDMRDGHAHLLKQGLNDSHVDIVITHLGATLQQLGAAAGDIADVAALANSVRDDVLGRSRAKA